MQSLPFPRTCLWHFHLWPVRRRDTSPTCDSSCLSRSQNCSRFRGRVHTNAGCYIAWRAEGGRRRPWLHQGLGKGQTETTDYKKPQLFPRVHINVVVLLDYDHFTATEFVEKRWPHWRCGLWQERKLISILSCINILFFFFSYSRYCRDWKSTKWPQRSQYCIA